MSHFSENLARIECKISEGHTFLNTCTSGKIVKEGSKGFHHLLLFDFPSNTSVNQKEVLKVVPVFIEGIHRLFAGVLFPVEINVISQARNEVCTGQHLSPI